MSANRWESRTSQRSWPLVLFQHYPIYTVHVGTHKPTLSETHIGRNLTHCYAYLIKLTLERISWWVRDHYQSTDPGNGRCWLVFSENSALPYEAIKDYLAKLRQGRGIYNCRIDWRFISHEDVEIVPHAPETPLHLADIAAGALFQAIDPTKRDHAITDDRFIRNMRDAICRNARQVYGLKIFPREAVERLSERRLLDFVRLL
jgi:hypothetical protein